MYFMVSAMYSCVPQGYDSYGYIVIGKANAEKRFEAEKADPDVVCATMSEAYVCSNGILTEGKVIQIYEAEEEM